MDELKKFQREFKKEFRLRWRKNDKTQTLVGKKNGRILYEFIMRPGKRIRPFLVFVASGAYSRKKLTKLQKEALWNCAVGIELFHAALLIHDDIMDASRLRRGKPTLHLMVGKNDALVVGDLAIGKAVDFLLATRIPEVVREYNGAYLITCEGQLLDEFLKTKKRVSKKELSELYAMKTAHYTAVGPLVAGSLIAKKKKSEIETFRNLGLVFGKLFQMKDDYDDEKNEKKSFLKKAKFDIESEFQKLYNRGRTFLAHSGIDNESKKIFDALFQLLAV